MCLCIAGACLSFFYQYFSFIGMEENYLLHAQQSPQSSDVVQEPTAAQSWLTSDSARVIGLGLLLSLGGALIWATILRRRIRTQIETIQFYEEEVSILNQRITATQHVNSSLFTSISNEIKSPLDDILSFSALLEETLFR